MASIWRLFTSLNTCIALLLALCAVMGGSSFLLTGDKAGSINAMPLVRWLVDAPFSWSWWLWVTLVLLVLLVLNTVACSCDSVWLRWRSSGIVTIIAPQLMHAGFLTIVLAHGISAVAGEHRQIDVAEGMVVQLPDGNRIGIGTIAADLSPTGIPVGHTCQLWTDPGRSGSRVTISPNHPWFSGGYGVHISAAETVPLRRARIEIRREPGAGAALAGAALFLAGNLAVLLQRSRRCDIKDVELSA